MSSSLSPLGSDKPQETSERSGALYADSHEALKAVREDFLYWTGRLTDSSFQLSLALIGANWAVFGSVEKILSNVYAKSSLGVVIASLTLNLVGAKWMGDLHLRRINYAAENLKRWEEECSAALGRVDPWPYTKGIDRLGRTLRWTKTWLPLMAGILFLVALVTA